MAIDSGEIVGVTPSVGWEAVILDPLHAEFTAISSDEPLAIHGVAIGSATNPTANRMLVTLVGDGNAMPEAMCEDSITIQDPTKYIELTCCPSGHVAGPELVVDGHFVGPNLPATDYTPWVSGPITQGQVAIFDMNQAYAANNNWVTPGFFNVFDTYLAADGHGTINQAAWSQQVTGLTPDAEYRFCTLVANLVKSGKNFDDPSIVLQIVDDANNSNTWTSSPLSVPENPKQWVSHSMTWTAPSPLSTSYTLRILSTVQDAIGNDFALDQVSFRECSSPPVDTCCKDLQTFCDDLEAGIVFSADSCKITMDLSALLPCYTIEWVDWGQGPEYGPWTPSTFPYPMHTFAGNGTYPISYLAIAYNDSNFICLEKIVTDTITVQCQSCSCGKSGFTLEMNGQTTNLFCYKGAPTPQLNCPAGDIMISGFFGCVDPADQLCDETAVNYTVTGPNGIIDQGATTNFPTFFFSASQVSTPGMYTLTATTLCTGQTDSCECVATWIMPPCDTCATVPIGLEAWWPMDEVGGEADANELNGNHPATSFPGPIGLGGPDPVVGKVDVTSTLLGALEFAGPNPGSYLSVGNTPALNFGNGAFSIDAWIMTTMPTQTSPIVDKLASQSTGYSFSIQGTSSLAFPTLAIGTTNGIEVFQGPAITVGQWNFVSVVVDPPKVYFCTGGDPGGSSTFSSSGHTMLGIPTASNSLPLLIGRNPLNPHWQIVIDELEIFSTAVDSSEMKRIWAADSLGKCDPSIVCVCGGFQDMFVRTPQGAMNMAVTCGGAPLTIPCPDPGKGFHLTGVFDCAGGACPPDHQIDWTLVHQNSATTHSGGFQDNDAFFGIHILPTYISQPGMYTLTMTGYCNGDTCVCEVQFIIDCPDLCPCDIQDILAFSANVNQGFAVALANKSCKACFSPLAVSDCETVEWYVGSTSGTPIGTSIGSQTFCYTFPFSGTYTINMVVTRLKPDGSLCEVFVYSKSITVTCLKSPICTTSVFPNPGFGEGAIGGHMTMGG
ncbi:MAG: LamG domain-containing protein [Saprospiraceae bacterium]|nr:LamG domain-containing protein [Saprospiraceae bacterium]